MHVDHLITWQPSPALPTSSPIPSLPFTQHPQSNQNDRADQTAKITLDPPGPLQRRLRRAQRPLRQTVQYLPPPSQPTSPQVHQPTNTTSTTSDETTTTILPLPDNRFLELLVRGVRPSTLHHPCMRPTRTITNANQVCLGLNFASNITMWALFTRALTASPSTTKTSVTNTSANFVVTALLGWAVFRESLPGTWWIGAGLMAAGCVLVGMREGA